MSEKIKDKINEIGKYLEELDSFAPTEFDEYEQNVEKKAACERYFEKIIEAVVDLTFLLLKNKNLKIPEEDKGAFDVLVKEKIITVELADRLKDAKGMRNILAHEYGVVDDTIVFESITEELGKDVRLLLEKVEEYLKSKG
ncbi:MAG: DUF86 domain-containing protein [Nanoarchaeota archaeon]|nr:DUF86 domain-containing protein [Nanoarchaeota archaeon]